MVNHPFRVNDNGGLVWLKLLVEKFWLKQILVETIFGPKKIFNQKNCQKKKIISKIISSRQFLSDQ